MTNSAATIRYSTPFASRSSRLVGALYRDTIKGMVLPFRLRQGDHLLDDEGPDAGRAPAEDQPGEEWNRYAGLAAGRRSVPS